jgi:hypothetical protein
MLNFDLEFTVLSCLNQVFLISNFHGLAAGFMLAESKSITPEILKMRNYTETYYVQVSARRCLKMFSFVQAELYEGFF